MRLYRYRLKFNHLPNVKKELPMINLTQSARQFAETGFSVILPSTARTESGNGSDFNWIQC
jgi:hypothetical protein